MGSSLQGAVAAASGCSAHVWQPFSKDDGHGYLEITHAAPVHAVRFNLNNKVVVSAGELGRLFLHYGNAALMGSLPSEEDSRVMDAINSVCFSRGSKLLAAGCQDGVIHVWDLKKQARRFALNDHRGAVSSVTYNLDDTQLASTSLSGEVLLHGKEAGNLIASLPTPNQVPRRSANFCSLEPLLTCAGSDGSVLVWDTSTQILTESFQALHKGAGGGVCFVPGSSALLFSVGADGKMMLVDRRLDTVAECLEVGGVLTSLGCKDDGTCMAVGNEGGVIQLFDPRKLASPLLKLTCPRHMPVVDLHWQHSPAGKSSRRLNLFIPPTPVGGPQPSRLGGASLANAAESFSPLVQGTPLKTPAPSNALRASILVSQSAADMAQAPAEGLTSPARPCGPHVPTTPGADLVTPVRGPPVSRFAAELAVPRLALPGSPGSPVIGGESAEDHKADVAGHEAPLPPDVQGQVDEALEAVLGQSGDMVREVREDMQALQLTMMHQLHLHQAEMVDLVHQLGARQDKLEASFEKLRQHVDHLVRKRDALTLWL